MKYKLTRNSIINGYIYPRGTIIPNKRVMLEGTWVSMFIKDGTLVLIDENVVKTKVVNMEDKMQSFEEANQKENEKLIPVPEVEEIPVVENPVVEEVEPYEKPKEKKINKNKKAGRPKKTKTEVV